MRFIGSVSAVFLLADLATARRLRALPKLEPGQPRDHEEAPVRRAQEDNVTTDSLDLVVALKGVPSAEESGYNWGRGWSHHVRPGGNAKGGTYELQHAVSDDNGNNDLGSAQEGPPDLMSAIINLVHSIVKSERDASVKEKLRKPDLFAKPAVEMPRSPRGKYRKRRMIENARMS